MQYFSEDLPVKEPKLLDQAHCPTALCLGRVGLFGLDLMGFGYRLNYPTLLLNRDFHKLCVFLDQIPKCPYQGNIRKQVKGGGVFDFLINPHVLLDPLLFRLKLEKIGTSFYWA
jgi:hypothetical protein